VTRAFEQLKQTGRTREVFDEFLGRSTTRLDQLAHEPPNHPPSDLGISVDEMGFTLQGSVLTTRRRRERPVLPRQAGYLAVHECSPRESELVPLLSCLSATARSNMGLDGIGVVDWGGRLEWSIGTDKDVGDHCPGQAPDRRGYHGRVLGSAGGMAASLGCARASVQRVSRSRAFVASTSLLPSASAQAMLHVLSNVDWHGRDVLVHIQRSEATR
jgi:hypothetical protein